MAVSHRHRCNSVERLTPFVATKIHAQDTTEGADACVSFQGHSAVTCVVDVAVQPCFCSSQCQSLNFRTCWAAASFASEKGCPPWASAAHAGMLQDNKRISLLLIFVLRSNVGYTRMISNVSGFTLCSMFQSSICPPESSAGLTTCRRFGTDLWRAPGGWERLGIAARSYSGVAPKRGSCYGLKHCRPMAGRAVQDEVVRGQLEVP